MDFHPPEPGNETERTIPPFAVANFDFKDSKEVVEQHIYEWNLDGYFYPIANLLGMDKIIQVPEHGATGHFGESHAHTALSLGVVGAALWFLFKVCQNLPFLLQQLSTILSFYKRKRRRRVGGGIKSWFRKSSPFKRRREGWGWGNQDHNHHRLDQYYATLVSSRELYEHEKYNSHMLHELVDEDLPQLVSTYTAAHNES